MCTDWESNSQPFSTQAGAQSTEPHQRAIKSYLGVTLKKFGLNLASYNNILSALAGVAQWIECPPVNQKVTVQFPVGARAWVVGQDPSRRCARGNHTWIFLSLSFSLPSPSLKINK